MTVRRRAVIAQAVLAAAAAAAPVAVVAGETLGTDFSFEAIEGGALNLGGFRGRVLLVVNTASFCGFTYQYKGLEALHAAMAARGLTVVGVPSQDFNQEKDSNGAVKAFCDATFDVRFPMTAITRVTGPQAHPFYRWIQRTRGWEPQWNFYKVLLGRDGRIAGLYGSVDEPDGARLGGDIAAALSAAA